jgi:S1-C subfamily serine protease
MSRALKYFLGGAAVVAAFVIALFLVGILPGSPNDDLTGGAVGTAAAIGAPNSTFDPAAIYQKSASGVVLVQSTFKNVGFGGASGQALGSGFVTSTNGTIVTNAHVVTENGVKASSITVAFRQGQDQSSQQVKATLVGVDPTGDIAVLKIDPAGHTLTPLPLGDSSKVAIGQWVVAIGNPLGYDFSLTEGIVSGIGRNLQSPNGATIPNGIQTDAAINQGNSGGPLLDQNGNVIGVNEQIASPSGSFSGLGFAIPINSAKTVIQQLETTGSAKHALLGIEGQTITPPVAQALKLPATQGVLVARVQPGTAAASAGLKGGNRTQVIQGAPYRVGGDVITKLNGQPLTGMDQLAATVAQLQPGNKITLTLVRGGQPQDITVALGNRAAGK